MNLFFYSFLFVAIFQSGYAYLQLAGLLSNPHSFFKMGGTIGNPNVLATFLSLILVYGFTYLLFSSKIKYKERCWLLMAFCFIFPVIILSQCRTAWLSLFVGFGVGLFFRFRMWSYFRHKTTWICLCVAIGLLSFASLKLYAFKQDSADGRLYIWKLTTEMILKKPLSGYGFNRFEREYNLYQASHFASLPDKEKNFNRSLYTETCCNDFIETTFELGVIGLLLFILIFFYAFKCFFKNLKIEKYDGHNMAAFASLIAFLLISLVNYNTVVPFSLLFLAFLLAVIPLPEKKIYSIKGYKILGLACCIGLSFLWIKEYDACKAQWKLEKMLEKETTKEEFLRESKDIREKLYPSGVNRSAYASILARTGFIRESLYELEEAKKVYSNYHMYIALGKCYTWEKRLKEAIEHFEIATNMAPLLILPRYRLLRLYHQAGNLEAAKRQATLILDIQPVKESEDILNVKEKAKQYLNTYP
ncbi:MAG: O-antigen ligase family protein [Candidatus Azobacteroides sp.]|nr:O-antigen ligase family protein [Candidatus Azobacteroides sp.]